MSLLNRKWSMYNKYRHTATIIENIVLRHKIFLSLKLQKCTRNVTTYPTAVLEKHFQECFHQSKFRYKCNLLICHMVILTEKEKKEIGKWKSEKTQMKILIMLYLIYLQPNSCLIYQCVSDNTRHNGMPKLYKFVTHCHHINWVEIKKTTNYV